MSGEIIGSYVSIAFMPKLTVEGFAPADVEDGKRLVLAIEQDAGAPRAACWGVLRTARVSRDAMRIRVSAPAAIRQTIGRVSFIWKSFRFRLYPTLAKRRLLQRLLL